MHPVITITCAFTRRWAVDKWLENLSTVKHDPTLTNLAIIVDIDDPYILHTIERYAHARHYRHLVTKMNESWHPNEVRLSARRPRIAEVKNQSKDLISQCDGDIVVGLEDDTVFEGMDLDRLIQPLLSDDQVGFVEGVQCGRWDTKMIGVWKVDDPQNPYEALTLFPEKSGYSEIDAGGWYGYATRKSLYINHEYYTASSQPYGPDVNFGLWVRSRGFKCLVDWENVFGHNDHNIILYPIGMLTQITFTKDKATGRWTRTDVVRQYN